MPQKTERPVAIVTGASRGVGAALTLLLAERGWNIVLNCSSTLAQAEAVAAEASQKGAETAVVQGDISEDGCARELAAVAGENFGRIDAVVNNAATTKFCDLPDMDGLDIGDFLRIYSVNVAGPFQLIRAALKSLRASPIASVVNVSSIAGQTGIGSSVAYAASKGALITMTRSLARALGPIRVNAVCPGFIQGDWLRQGLGEEIYEGLLSRLEASTPLRLASTPEQVARGIYYLLAEADVVTGETLLLDGGSHLPPLAYRP